MPEGDKVGIGWLGRINVSVSLTALLAGVGSGMSVGAVTDAVLTSWPVADAPMRATRVNLAVPPTSKSTVVATLPVPVASPHADPAEATHVHVASVSAAGSVSVTAASVTTLGPLFLTTIV
jgi:hypothetical protein